MVLKAQKSKNSICMHSMSPGKARFHVPAVLYFVPNATLRLEQILVKFHIKEVQKGLLFIAKI